MIYMDSHGIRFTLNDFSAPCPLCELGEKKKTTPAGQNRPNLQHPNDQTWRGWDLWWLVLGPSENLTCGMLWKITFF